MTSVYCFTSFLIVCHYKKKPQITIINHTPISQQKLCCLKKMYDFALSRPLTTFSRVRLSLKEAKTPTNETTNMTIPRRIRIIAGAKNTPSIVLKRCLSTSAQMPMPRIKPPISQKQSEEQLGRVSSQIHVSPYSFRTINTEHAKLATFPSASLYVFSQLVNVNRLQSAPFAHLKVNR